jgi:hypothetical protein
MLFIDELRERGKKQTRLSVGLTRPEVIFRRVSRVLPVERRISSFAKVPGAAKKPV